MRKVLAICGLTWKSAFRYRLFWVMLALLIGAVAGLPMILKDDGTAKGLTQILLTYTLSSVATLLGFATLWLSCGTLAKDVEECQMQVVAVKPIARWQVWLGKLLGIITLDAVLLALAGTSIFFLLQWRASKLPAPEQAVLRREIFVARAGATERPPDLGPEIEKQVETRVGKTQLSETDLAEVRKQAAEYVVSEYTDVPPGGVRMWKIDLSSVKAHLRNEPLQIRVKFHTSDANTDKEYRTTWFVGPTNALGAVVIQEQFPPDSFQEFRVPPNLIDDRGQLIVQFLNGYLVPGQDGGANMVPNANAMIFPLEDGFQVLYPESSFGMNFIRGLMILLFWLALLATIGLACASFLSFPVAAFVSLALLLLGLSSGTISMVVQNGTITGYDAAKGGYGHSPVDLLLVPIFDGALKIIQLVEGFSPVDALSSGHSVTWTDLGWAFVQIVLILGGFFCVLGMILFARRELATAQSNN